MKKIVVCLMLTACGSSQPPPKPRVHQADLDAWTDVPVAELELQPFYSTKPKSVQRISSGGELWTYTNCRAWRTDRRCVAQGHAGRVFGTVQYQEELTCRGGEAGQLCCHGQFFVHEQTVKWHRVVGDCSTNCESRPASRPCGTQ